MFSPPAIYPQIFYILNMLKGLEFAGMPLAVRWQSEARLMKLYDDSKFHIAKQKVMQRPEWHSWQNNLSGIIFVRPRMILYEIFTMAREIYSAYTDKIELIWN